MREIRLQLALNTTMTIEQLNAHPLLGGAIRDGVLRALGISSSSSSGLTATFMGFTALTSSTA